MAPPPEHAIFMTSVMLVNKQDQRYFCVRSLPINDCDFMTLTLGGSLSLVSPPNVTELASS